jgi:environmental stress-induced protein Ves
MSSPSSDLVQELDPGFRVVRAHGRPRTPWRNGLGLTEEIAMSPDGAGYADFDWRVSIAEMTRDAEFSRFPGVERTLTLLTPGAVELAVGGVVKTLSQYEPVGFPGDVPVSARLLAGPARDLNVMTRRDRVRASVRVEAIGPLLAVNAPRDETLVMVVLRGQVSAMRATSFGTTLGAHDALVGNGLCRLLLSSGEGGSMVALIRFARPA